jgi:hypothetical protein
LKATILCIGLALAAVPLAAAAQVAPPAPAATASPAPPQPLPPEHFLNVDGGVAGITYNELSPGNPTNGWGIRGVAEVPVIGHNWMAQFDYRSYSYNHAAQGLVPNGVVFGCPGVGDQGCVTPVAASTYNATFNPGPINYLNAVNANDSVTQIGLGTKIAPVERYYISVGYVFRAFNYLNYPVQTGLGFGLDKLPDVDRAISVYGNFWVWFNVQGQYTGPSAGSLGPLSGYKTSMNYRMYTYRIGATFSLPRTPFFLDLSDIGDEETVTSNGPSNEVHNMLLVGAGVKL